MIGTLKQLKKSYISVFLIIVGLLVFVSDFYLYKVRNKSGNPIRSDGIGYYSYLPAFFKYDDLTFSFVDSISYADSINMKPCLWTDKEGHIINKYPIGVAILESPFYFATDTILKIFSPGRATGFSKLYQYSICFSAFVYFLLGLWLLYKSLMSFFDEKTVLLVLTLITFATSLFHYATLDGCFSHVYSFFLINLFVFLTIKDFEENSVLFKLCGGGY